MVGSFKWMGKWKGIRQKMIRKGQIIPLKIELYDLSVDESETEDLASLILILLLIKQLMTDLHVPSEEFPMAVIDLKIFIRTSSSRISFVVFFPLQSGS